MVKIREAIDRFSLEFASRAGARPTPHFSRALAEALTWSEGGANLESLHRRKLPCEINRARIGNEPAVLFFGHELANAGPLLRDAARFAYHASVEWGVVTNFAETQVFNSHWIKDQDWFYLPTIHWNELASQSELLDSLSPSNIFDGKIDKIAYKISPPDKQLLPIDDGLVDRLDRWRSEALRYSRTTKGVDDRLQTLFAQLFVLRAVEDRGFAPGLPSLLSLLRQDKTADVDGLIQLLRNARALIQSDLYNNLSIQDVPDFVLGGIIRDLYTPPDLPLRHFQYDFSLIDADVLGRAYEKYLSTVLVPYQPVVQPTLFDPPLREVERVTRRKAAGVYYTPPFIVNHLVTETVNKFFAEQAPGKTTIPSIADVSCGSGSLLTAAADCVIRKLRERQPNENWGRRLVEEKCIVGVDSDERAVSIAQLSLWLRLAEEPSPLPLPALKETIVCGDSLSEATWANLPAHYDIILGNPPFLATGKVQTRDDLAKRFEVAKGRFDYSYLFVELALNKLKDRGSLGFVVPNRLFRNRDALALREILLDKTQIRTLIDFGSTEVFQGTPGSLVGLVILTKSRPSSVPEHFRYARIKDLPRRYASALLTHVSATTGELKTPYLIAFDARYPISPESWSFLSPSAAAARVSLDRDSEDLASVAGIFQGIKTGANDIFIVELISPTVDSVICQVRNGLGDVFDVESASLRPVIYGSDIQRYSAASPSRYLIYPYRNSTVIPEAVFKNDFPLAYRCLTSYRPLLEARSSATASGKAWYELVRERDEAWLNQKKLLMRDLATEPSFAVDFNGTIFLVGGTAIVPVDPADLFPLMAYLNSEVSKWYLTQVSPNFKSGFQKFEPQHLSRIPVPNKIIAEGNIKDKLDELAQDVIRYRSASMPSEQAAAEREINRIIATLIDVDVAELT